MRESITYFVSQALILVGMLTAITQMALMVDVSVVSVMVGLTSLVMCPEREQKVVKDPNLFLGEYVQTWIRPIRAIMRNMKEFVVRPTVTPEIRAKSAHAPRKEPQ
jgi:hypothetical protein